MSMNLSKDIIIFEGLDRTGKGSHIQYLKDFCKPEHLQYFHCTGPDKYFNNTAEERNLYQAAIFYSQLKEVQDFHNLYKDNKLTIFDRAFLGEYVWSIFYKRMDKTYDEYYVINKIFNSKVYQDIKDQILVIFLLTDPDILIERIKSSTEDTTIFTKFNYMNIKDNIKYLTDLYKKLEEICIQNGLKTITLYSNIESDIKNNAQIILEKMKEK